MLDINFVAKIRKLAIENGLDPHNYTVRKILNRGAKAISSGKTQAEFMTELLREVKFRKGNY